MGRKEEAEMVPSEKVVSPVDPDNAGLEHLTRNLTEGTTFSEMDAAA